MVKNLHKGNLVFGLLLIIGLIGSAYELYRYNKILTVNRAIQSGEQITDKSYPQLQKFAAAYAQGKNGNYKHAVQTYGQLLDTSPSLPEQAKIQYNIGNNLFIFGLIRRMNDDGTLQDEARYAYSQAKIAYEQSLRLSPQSLPAKFNLSLLNSVMFNNMKAAPKEQSTMELSNLPIGLP